MRFFSNRCVNRLSRMAFALFLATANFIVAKAIATDTSSAAAPPAPIPSTKPPILAIPRGGLGELFRIEYPPSTETNELQVGVTYTLWIPGGVPRLRGIIVHQHGAGTTAAREGSTAAYDLHWQALAKKWDCALLGPTYHVLHEKNDASRGASGLWFDPTKGSEKTFLKALGDLAKASGHPELETVPWALWGHSGGGIWSDVMSTLHPERVIAMWLRSGSAAMFRTHPEFPQPTVPAACYAIPIMLNPGVKEKSSTTPDVKGKEKGPWLGNLATFREYRAKGAFVGFAPDPRTGHECGDSRYLAIPFLDACLAMRLPDKGAKDESLKPVDTSQAWLAPVLGDEAQPEAAFQGSRDESVWLPNAALAKAWMEYVKTGAVADTTPPPAPFDVQASQQGDQGTEVIWRADADFESGIGGFVVMRDGEELAKVPEKPAGQFGRALFQGMTYHDTPTRPLEKMRYVDATAKPGEKHSYAVIAVNSVGLRSEPATAVAKDFHFDSSISREVLENYLDRSISFTELLHDDLTKPRNSRGVDPQDNVRLILESKAKFVGRALMVWGRERNLSNFLQTAKPYVERLHEGDPDIVLQAAAFEIVTKGVESISIPEPVLVEFNQTATNRNFRYEDMLYTDGRFVNHWGNGSSVPDMSRLETRMWFYFLASSYLDVGIEAIHFGQVGLMDKNDPRHAGWLDMLGRVRSYAHAHARRHFVICDAHTPTGGYVEDGKLLFDVHAFPLRIAEVPDQPHKGVLKVGNSDSIYLKSKGGITPSGWSCEHLPYLVEFDNFGGRNQGSPSRTPFIWGWDEITWFAVMPEAERNEWLRYAWKWVKDTDSNGHLEMPGSRVLSPGRNGGSRWYWANTRTDACPNGYDTEETIKALWATNR